MDHGFDEPAAPRPDAVDLRAAMLEVDLIALRLRVAAAKADVQLRAARCALLEASTRARLLSRQDREEQREYLKELRTAIGEYAHLLGRTGASREQVVCLVKDTVHEVIGHDGLGSAAVNGIVQRALELAGDSPAA